MSLIKVKFNRGKARRTKLSSRNKIEYLLNVIKKKESEKNALVKKMHDNIKIFEDELKFERANVDIIEDELKSEKMKVDTLKNQIECPVCLEVPRKGPVFACPNGHLVCKRCKQETCSICMEDVGDNKSLVALAVIETILHDCKFVECGEELPLKDVEEHEKVCDHRFVACPYYGQCDQMVPLSKLVDHLEENACSSNRVPIIVTRTSGAKTFNLSILEKLQNPQLSWKMTTYRFERYFFVLKVNKIGDYWRFVITMFESPEVCSKFNLEIEVYETNSCPDTRPSARVHCNPCSVDQTAAEMEGFGLHVPHKFMMKMILKEDSFKFTVSFSFL